MKSVKLGLQKVKKKQSTSVRESRISEQRPKTFNNNDEALRLDAGLVEIVPGVHKRPK
jgi:hypothetical protein